MFLKLTQSSYLGGLNEDLHRIVADGDEQEEAMMGSKGLVSVMLVEVLTVNLEHLPLLWNLGLVVICLCLFLNVAVLLIFGMAGCFQAL